MQNEIIIYVDESGNTDCKILKSGASKFYTLVAICLYPEQLNKVNKIMNTKFKERELKASKIRGKNTKRLMDTIALIASLDFQYYALIIDKTQIHHDSGLKYKKSFIKFFHDRLYQKVCSHNGTYNIFADSQGYPKFQNEFYNYLDKKFDTPMLKAMNYENGKNFNFHQVDSKDYRGVQLADFVSNMLMRVINKKIEYDSLSPIIDKAIRIQRWPPEKITKVSMRNHLGNSEVIRSISYHEIMEFLESTATSEKDEDIIRFELVQLLLQNYTENPEKYLYSTEIAKHLSKTLDVEINDKKVTNIIAKMRSEDIPIVSSSCGYKIPYSIEDVRKYIDKVRSVVCPYMERLGNFRNKIKESSPEHLDILDGDELTPIRRYLDKI